MQKKMRKEDGNKRVNYRDVQKGQNMQQEMEKYELITKVIKFFNTSNHKSYSFPSDVARGVAEM